MKKEDFKPGVWIHVKWNNNWDYVVEVIKPEPNFQAVWRELNSTAEKGAINKAFSWPAPNDFLAHGVCTIVPKGWKLGQPISPVSGSCATCKEGFPYEVPPSNRTDGLTDCTRCKIMKGVFRK